MYAICLPSPLEALPIEGIHPATATGETIARPPSTSEPFCGLVFKIVSDPFAGRLAYTRVYSGSLKTGENIYNVSRERKERTGRLLQMAAGKRNEIRICQAGDIAAIVGLKHTFTGETLSAASHPILLESIEFPDPVIRIAVELLTNADQDRLINALTRLDEEDPTFMMSYDEQSGQTIISGIGELHLEVFVECLRREFDVKCKVCPPQVAYRETVTQQATAEGRYIQQTGGHGHYAVVKLEIGPNEQGKGLLFEHQITGGKLPRKFIAAVERGLQGAMEAGIFAGYPVVDTQVTLVDDKFHDVDSSKEDFEIAASMGFKEACRWAGPILLEPMMLVESTAPEEYVGNIVNDFSRWRGHVNKMLASGDRLQNRTGCGTAD